MACCMCLSGCWEVLSCVRHAYHRTRIWWCRWWEHANGTTAGISADWTTLWEHLTTSQSSHIACTACSKTAPLLPLLPPDFFPLPPPDFFPLPPPHILLRLAVILPHPLCLSPWLSPASVQGHHGRGETEWRYPEVSTGSKTSWPVCVKILREGNILYGNLQFLYSNHILIELPHLPL